VKGLGEEKNIPERPKIFTEWAILQVMSNSQLVIIHGKSLPPPPALPPSTTVLLFCF
jgi:hypothetical protein